MGREKTGAETCEESLRLELSFLLKEGYIKKQQFVKSNLSWTNGANISLESKYSEDEKWIRLVYTLTNNRTKEKTDFDYIIELTSVPSNLGHGEVLYFVCPVTGKRCRILYMAYDYPKWKSREAYNNRLYYSNQLSSKMNYPNDAYWSIRRRFEKILNRKRTKLFYRGKPTKSGQRLMKMKQRINHWDLERFQSRCMPFSLRKMMEERFG